MTVPVLYATQLATRGSVELGAVARELAADLGVALPLDLSRSILRDETEASASRTAALDRLCDEGGETKAAAIRIALASDDPLLRVRAREWWGETAERWAEVDRVLAAGPIAERQGTVQSLARAGSAPADQRIEQLFDRFLAGSLPPALSLEVVEAMEFRAEEIGEERWARYQQTLPEGDELAPYRITEFGGDRNRGRRIFREHPVAQCSRCHIAEGDGGVAGPPLDGLGKTQTRAQLLESIILPNAAISEGYGTGGEPSAMPQVHFALEASEIRDLVEFLATLGQ